MQISKMLTGHEFFRSLLPEMVDRISNISSAKKIEKGEAVYGVDKKATHIFVLLEGQVELRLPGSSGDPGFHVSRVGRGEFFGIAPLMNADRYTTLAVCTRTSKVLFIEAKPLMEMLKNHPSVGFQVMTVVARAYFERYQHLMERIQKALSDLGREP
ncbi:MAG: cyclic nucleotide-binding domain protein [Acidobacteria bacterium]|nr:cyclic nucleotide-binding domain protein [Acidobacteriota bacterium]